MDRRNFLKLAGIGGLELVAHRVDAKPGVRPGPRLVRVDLNYKAPLGNNPTEDRIATFEMAARRYEELGDYLSGRGSLIIPEDALIREVKDQHIAVNIDLNQTGISTYNTVLSQDKPKWDPQRGAWVTRRLIGFDLPKYLIRNDPTLIDLTRRIVTGYRTREEQAQALLCFVQTAISYDHAKVERADRDQNRDFVRNPKRTLYDRVGDCKDTSVLYANLLLNLGVRPIFIRYDDHVNVGVPLDFDHNRNMFAPERLYLDGKTTLGGTGYYIAETTPESPMYVGKLMESQRGRKIKQYITI